MRVSTGITLALEFRFVADCDQIVPSSVTWSETFSSSVTLGLHLVTLVICKEMIMPQISSTELLRAGLVQDLLSIRLGALLIVVCLGCEEVSSTPAPPPPLNDPAVTLQASPKATTVTPTVPDQSTPAANLEDPQAAIAKFLNTSSTERRDNDLLRVCNLSSGTESINNMDLNSSPVTDEGIKNLAKLQNLETINFTSTRITEVGFAVTQELPKLRSLNLTNINITPAMLATLGHLENLEDLSLERTTIGDAALATLENLVNLKSLNLTGTQISDNAFRILEKMKSLEVLKIGHTAIRGDGLKFLKRKKGDSGLRVLNAQHSQFGLAGLQFLRNVETLEDLDLSQAEVTDRALQALKGVNHLKKLNLGFNQITDQGLIVLANTKGLEELSLTNLAMVGDFTLKNLAKNKDLQRLDINGTSCTINGVTSLKKLLPNCEIRFMGAVQ